MRYIDLFAGIGGFHEGLRRASNNREFLQGAEEENIQGELPKLEVGQNRFVGIDKNAKSSTNNQGRTSQHSRCSFHCVWANEWDKYAAQIYKKNFPRTEISITDIRTIDTDRLPEFDLLCGGFPCQAFSLAGKRKGFDDTRGTLFFEIAKIIKAKRPKIVLLENVKGLLSHEAGRTFGRIIEVLGELGYWVEWQVLNSKDFGVPQNRERVFIVGHLGKEGGQKIFPIGEGNEININQRQELSEQISNTLRTNYSSAFSNETYILGKEISYAIDANYYKGTNTTEKGRRQLVMETNSIRRLTPIECERLQGFPDGWTGQGKIFNDVQLIGNIWEEINVQSMGVKDRQLLENQCFALNITRDGKNGETLTQYIQPKEKIKGNAQYKAVIEKLSVENSVCDITSLGKDMVMLCSQKETSNIEEIMRKNLIQEKMVEPNTYPLWKISLEENLNKEKLSIILTLIKKTILKKIFVCAKTGKNIINVIIVWNKQGLNFSEKDILNLRMENTALISDTQRYKCLGNAVTVNVIEALGNRILEAAK